MRLLYRDSTGSLVLRNFDSTTLPAYGILSHTWNPDNSKEVTLKDVESGIAEQKTGYHKLQFCEAKANEDGLSYFWIDTCCIDQGNQNELAEAINSMFRWYQNADRCYVYLADVTAELDLRDHSVRFAESNFRESRWFTRGWTLQELLAPRKVEFFSNTGDRLGSKSSLETLVHEVTGISREALQGRPLTEFSITLRRSWSAQRRTKREEDMVYALLGIFEVHMPLIYGEGKAHAMGRLEDEIHKKQKAIKISETSKFEDAPDQALKDEIISYLGFKQINNRKDNIKRHQLSTCKWLVSHSAFRAWVSESRFFDHNGFLWLKGKPGSGKSTLTKFALSHVRKQAVETNELLLDFFFDARGTDLERNTIGLYRSLILQLITAWPGEKELTLPELIDWDLDHALETDLEGLMALFSQLVHEHERSIRIIIDALDECNEDEIRDMIGFLEELGMDVTANNREFRVMLSSRHYPHITASKSLDIIVEQQQGHFEDIQRYVSAKFRVGKGEQATKIREQICERSSGIFMWVVLVIEILNKITDRGQYHMLQDKLCEIPSDLFTLFQDILTRDHENIQETKLCLQLVFHARRPLKLEELYFAILSGLDTVTPQQLVDLKVSTTGMSNFILHSSKGLAKVTNSKDEVVQFIHESIRDFLSYRRGLARIWPELDEDFTQLSHDQCKSCCWKYINACLQSVSPIDDANAQATGAQRTAKWPFLAYATRHLFAHAELAQLAGLDQRNFLRELDLVSWVRVNNMVEETFDQHLPETNLLYVLADKNHSHLIDLIVESEAKEDIRRGLHGNPIFAAIARNNAAAFRSLIKHDANKASKPRQFPYQHEQTYEFLVRQAPELVNELLSVYTFNEQLTSATSPSLIRDAAAWGQDKLIELLLRQGIVDKISSADLDSALLVAVLYGHRVKVVEVLLDAGASPHVRDGDDTLLQTAAGRHGGEKVISLLVKHGADVNFHSGYYGNALQAAAASPCIDHEKIVDLLLKAGANANAKGGYFGTSLYAATAANGNKTVIAFLLKAGADVNASGRDGERPLHAAARRGELDNVKALLNAGADVNLTDDRDQAAIHVAIKHHRKKIIDLLSPTRIDTPER